jgi:hypothetical protein
MRRVLLILSLGAAALVSSCGRPANPTPDSGLVWDQGAWDKATWQ